MIIECRTFIEFEKKIKALEELNISYETKKEVIQVTLPRPVPPYYLNKWTIKVKELSACPDS